LKYISTDELDKFRQSGSGLYSITIYADKHMKGNAAIQMKMDVVKVNQQLQPKNLKAPVPHQIGMVWVVVDSN
jgi:hypothetical protein